MAKSFGTAHGSAKKNNLDYAKLEMGTNEFRLVGELLPRYAYWKELNSGGNSFSIPVECLSFDRELEEFTNIEKDWFKHHFPAEKCVWSYLVQCIDKDNKLKMFGLKKKLFDQIMEAAETLGDPTDPKTGWPIKFTKKSNGPNAFNIEYSLLQLQLKPAPLTAAQKEAIKDMKPIDELVPRQTPEQQLAFIEQAWLSTPETNVSNEAIDELKHDEYDTFKKKDEPVLEEDVPM